MIEIFKKERLIAGFFKDKEFVLEYKDFDIINSIALSLPNTQKFYISNQILPYFDTYLPEGYLFEIFKNYLIKEYGYIDDYLLFKILSPNIEGRLGYKSNSQIAGSSIELNLEDILQNDTPDTFNYLVQTFLGRNAIGGVQPKSVAVLRESLKLKKYIVKSWGSEYKYLAQNEYLSLKTVEFAGIRIPNIYLSKNRNFLIVEKFDSNLIGFEEVISLMGKLKVNKYSGSYEQVAKEIYKYVSNPPKEMKIFFKMIVMNYLLKNGDAHLKNFGLLFNDDFSNIYLSPAYDVVTTTAYIFRDKPALMLDGKKIWHGKNKLIEFGIKSCYLKEREANELFDNCMEAVKKGMELVKKHIEENPDFEIVGNRMIDSWSLSLDLKTYKEIPFELAGTWSKDKNL